MTPQSERIAFIETVLAALFAVVMAFALILMLVQTVPADAICLTKKQARYLWPRQHIYWYSKNHCWSNRRGGPPRNIKMDPIVNSHAQVPTKQQVFDKRPATKQDKILDMDEWRANNCCWPEFPRDHDGNIIEPFSERAMPIPFAWWTQKHNGDDR